MKLDPTEPPRVDDVGPTPLRDLVHGTRRDAPGAAAMERMSKRLATAGALSKAAASASSASPALSWASYKLGAVALAVTAGLAFTWQVTVNSAGERSENTQAVTQESSASADSRSPLVMVGGPAETAPRPTPPAVSVDELPSAAPATSVRSPSENASLSATAPPPSPRAAAREASEFELFQRAQAALPSDPERALALTGEQARAYPSGEFVQEREVIAVEALSRIGRKDEAYRRAAALIHRFPRTPYAARLEIAVGRALAPASDAADRAIRGDAGSSHATPNP